MNNHKMIVSFKHKKYSKKKFGTFILILWSLGLFINVQMSKLVC